VKTRGGSGRLDRLGYVRPCSHVIGLRYLPMSRSRRSPRLYYKDGHGQCVSQATRRHDDRREPRRGLVRCDPRLR
jgi:hypothetical protein